MDTFVSAGCGNKPQRGDVCAVKTLRCDVCVSVLVLVADS